MNTKNYNNTQNLIHILDVAKFAHEKGGLTGSILLSNLLRLQKLISQTEKLEIELHWQAQGRTESKSQNESEIWLDIQIQGELPLTCQRCLQNMEYPIAVKRSFRFVYDEEAACALDEELEQDVLVLSPEFDLLSLIEDEIIMAIPYAPKHASCTQPITPTGQNDPVETNPFAKLQQLKKQ